MQRLHRVLIPLGGLVAIGATAFVLTLPVHPLASRAAARGTRSQAEQTCTFLFFATVQDGPDAGRQFLGPLTLTIDTAGGATGMLQRDGGTPLPVVGQVDGRAVNLSFDLSDDFGPGARMAGVGTAVTNLLPDCDPGHLIGPLVGPDLNDRGVWEHRSRGG